MREFALDDAFWRHALGALRAGSRGSALSIAYPEYAQLLAEVEAEASHDATVIGARVVDESANGRLLALLSAVFFARAGYRTLLVDLSSDRHWLERLTGEDFSEGIADHLRYGITLEQCVADTAIPNLSALTVGSAKLGGMLIDDVASFRATIDRLRQHYRVVVLAFPESEETSEEGIAAACDSVLTISDQELIPENGAGNGNGAGWLARLKGEPDAADELTRLSQRFLGPLPSLLGDTLRSVTEPETIEANPFFKIAGTGTGATVEQDESEDDVAFLSGFEEARPAGDSQTTIGIPGLDVDDVVEIDEAAERSPFDRGLNRLQSRLRRRAATQLPRRRSWWVITSFVAVALIGGLMIGRRIAPFVDQWLDDTGGPVETVVAQLDVDAPRPGADNGTIPGEVIAIAPANGESSGGNDAEADAAPPQAVSGSSSLPLSVHAGSYQNGTAARDVARRIEAAGILAFVTPIDIAERGRWYRVHAGVFADATAAGAVRTELLDRDVVDDALVRSTPLTFELGEYERRGSAVDRQRELTARGISTYIVGNGPYHVYAGAFSSSEEGSALQAILAEAAEPISMIQRHE